MRPILVVVSLSLSLLLILSGLREPLVLLDGAEGPALFQLGGWSSLGILARLSALATVAVLSLYLLALLPARDAERQQAFAEAAFVLSIVLLTATVVLTLFLDGTAQVERGDDQVRWALARGPA